MSRPTASAARSIMRPNPAVEKGAPRSDTNTNGEAALFALEPTQSPQLAAAQWVCARLAVLDPTDVQDSRIEVDLVPAKVDNLRRA
jgi:hypothetical protein